MDYAAAVGAFETLTNIGAVFQDLGNGKRAFGQAVGQGFAFQKFHDKVVGAVLVADIVKSADVGVVQGRDSAGFAIEALFGFGTLRKMVWQDLYRDSAIQ